MQRVEADAESIHDTGPERLHDDVGVGGEPVERLDPLADFRSIVTERHERFHTAYPL